jgi:hypothetical protein
MDHVDALVGHLAWPLVALAIVILFRRQLHELLAEIRRRVRDENTSLSVKAGPLDVRIIAVEAKVRALDANHSILKVDMKDVVGARRTSPSSAEIPAELIDIANRYLAIEIPTGAPGCERRTQLRPRWAALSSCTT